MHFLNVEQDVFVTRLGHFHLHRYQAVGHCPGLFDVSSGGSNMTVPLVN